MMRCNFPNIPIMKQSSSRGAPVLKGPFTFEWDPRWVTEGDQKFEENGICVWKSATEKLSKREIILNQRCSRVRLWPLGGSNLRCRTAIRRRSSVFLNKRILSNSCSEKSSNENYKGHLFWMKFMLLGTKTYNLINLIQNWAPMINMLVSF